MNREKLKRIVESIEAAEKAIKTYSDHKRDIYSTNKDEFEPKVLRKIIARRKMDPDSRTKDDDLLDQYESALGMTGKLAAEAAAGERTYDDAAKAAGVSRRTMARQVARARTVPNPTANGTPHDPDTGEVRDDAPPETDPTLGQTVDRNEGGTHDAGLLTKANGQPFHDCVAVAGDETVAPASPPPDAAIDDMMAEFERLQAMKREKGIAA